MRTLPIAPALMALAACETAPPVEAPVYVEPTTIVYQCDSEQVLARFSGQAVELWLREDTRRLSGTPAASGVRYEGEEGLLFSTRGLDQAVLKQPGLPEQSCRAGPPAAWRGAVEADATFRAVGQEPGWLLDLYPQRYLHLRADYGTLQVYAPMPAPRREGDALVYDTRSDSRAVRLEITGTPCRDAMSAQPYPATVRVTLDGTAWEGCGMALDGAQQVASPER